MTCGRWRRGGKTVGSRGRDSHGRGQGNGHQLMTLLRGDSDALRRQIRRLQYEPQELGSPLLNAFKLFAPQLESVDHLHHHFIEL
ncbi:hypothetical protein O3P69_005168 [Scylla paramamosain]|uniref:Uncharacterized protein n=1 Tax=Scylla paramamosain TaxID=85552 RepID=A0AAW0UC23_SCYPA